MKYITVTSANIALIDKYSPNTVLRAFKVTTEAGHPPTHAMNKPTVYEVGKTYTVTRANTNPARDCARGLHVATLRWCSGNFLLDSKSKYTPRYRLFVVEFMVKHIAAVPFQRGNAWSHPHFPGKFRLKKFKIVKEIPLPLKWS